MLHSFANVQRTIQDQRSVSVVDRVGYARLFEPAESKCARIACSAGLLRASVARPCKMQRGIQADRLSYDLSLGEMDDRRPYLDAGFGPCSGVDHLLERLVKLRPAIRITARIFRDRADVDTRRADRLGPTRRYCKHVRVAKRHIARWDLRRIKIGLRNIDTGIR